MAAVDYFLKIDGVSGESTDEAHKGEIEVESFSWGVSQASTRLGGGAGAGRAVFQDLSFTSTVSTASPTLLLKCATGQHLKEAVLTCRKAGGKLQQDFLKITLSDVLVSSYQTGAASDQPVDSAGLRYGSAKLTEGPQQHIDIAPAAGGLLVYDAKTGRVETYPDGPEILPVGTADGSVSRLVREFDVHDLLGLLAGPFPTGKLRLSVTELRTERPPTDGAPRRGPEPHMHFDVLVYTPADLALTADDLTRRGRRIGSLHLDPRRDPTSFATDLAAIDWGDGSFGVRLQLRGAPVPGAQNPPEPDHPPDPGLEADERSARADLAGRNASAVFSLSLEYDSA